MECLHNWRYRHNGWDCGTIDGGVFEEDQRVYSCHCGAEKVSCIMKYFYNTGEMEIEKYDMIYCDGQPPICIKIENDSPL